MGTHQNPLTGRGAGFNPNNRFAPTHLEEYREDPEDEPPPRLATELIDDRTRNIIATNDSPDVGFTASVNSYRGCEHGCVYCYLPPQNSPNLPAI